MRPDEKQLEQMIAAAFDRLPAPDATRLKAVEERLGRHASRGPKLGQARSMYWWLLLGLAATGAAAWWSGTLWQPPMEVPPARVETKLMERREGAAPSETERSKETHNERDTATDRKRSPTIYRREYP